MHILFLTDNFFPESNASASRTYAHAKEWVKTGESVTIITCVPNFPTGKVFDGYQNKLWKEEMIDGIRVIRVWSYITINKGFFLRSLDHYSFMIMAFFTSFFVRKVDVIVATSPQFFSACAGWMVSVAKRKPWVFEIRDIWPEAIKEVGAIQNSLVIHLLEKIEMFLYKKANTIVSVTNSFKQILIDRGIEGNKIFVITHGVDFSIFSPIEKDQKLLAELNLEGKFVAGYIGTHGLAHGLQTLIEAAVVLSQDRSNDDICLLFIGNGAERQALVELSKQYELNNVLFLNSVPKADVSRYWSLLDVSIIHLRKVELFKSVIPSKIFDCMGMGLPILLGVPGESADIVVNEGIGEVFEPENVEELASRLSKLKSQERLLSSYKNATQIAARKYNRHNLAIKMLKVLRLYC